VEGIEDGGGDIPESDRVIQYLHPRQLLSTRTVRERSHPLRYPSPPPVVLSGGCLRNEPRTLIERILLGRFLRSWPAHEERLVGH
jgi:hypothetical protein